MNDKNKKSMPGDYKKNDMNKDQGQNDMPKGQKGGKSQKSEDLTEEDEYSVTEIEE